MLNIREKMDQAFREIQKYPAVYQRWCDCKSEQERQEMLAEALWEMAFQEGYAKCDEDVSMGG